MIMKPSNKHTFRRKQTMKNIEMKELQMDQLENVTGGIFAYPFEKPIVKPTKDATAPQRITFLDKMSQTIAIEDVENIIIR